MTAAKPLQGNIRFDWVELLPGAFSACKSSTRFYIGKFL
jgi:hypothetical protein